MALNKVLKVNSSSELLSYIINVTPELSSEIDLPVQGESIAPIGKIILSNQRYKNAFLNTINLIGLTIINRNYWENPWEWFANKGTLNFGQTVRELLVDIADVFDYNEFADDPTHFLENEVPNIYNYLHELNYQKFYKTTTSDAQIAMAFNTEEGLFDLVEKIISSLYEGYKYDKYIVDKYQLCRRIVDGTITSVEIPNSSVMSVREKVSFMKSIANQMEFRNPNYNPAGALVANTASELILIMNTDFQASVSTEVLATSFFKDDADFKMRSALIDGFGNHNDKRLKELLGSAYTPFTADELAALKNIPAVIVSYDFFQDRLYALNNDPQGTNGALKSTEFYNPESLKANHWLHVWAVISTSPYAQACILTEGVTPAVTSVSLNPSEMSVSAGQTVKLTPTVVTTGFANKAVTYAVTKADGQSNENPVTVDQNGNVTIPPDYAKSTESSNTDITITATSVYDNTKSGTAKIIVL